MTLSQPLPATVILYPIDGCAFGAQSLFWGRSFLFSKSSVRLVRECERIAFAERSPYATWLLVRAAEELNNSQCPNVSHPAPSPPTSVTAPFTVPLGPLAWKVGLLRHYVS